MAMEPFRVGLIGCGNISGTYLRNALLFPRTLRFVACADIAPEAADRVAQAWNLRAATPTELLADAGIDIVLNLTVPAAHAGVSEQALLGGKHVYSEKPAATGQADVARLEQACAATGMRFACAPDTILGAAHQAARAAIDAGRIGRPVSVHAAVMDRGMEGWHPDPRFFFKAGGGPVMDMGPYYIAAMASLLGPVRSIAAHRSRGITERIAAVGARAGERVKVEVDTTVHALLGFRNGCNGVFSASWDVWDHSLPHLEICGTEGTIRLADPNWFGDAPTISREGGSREPLELDGFAFGQPNRTLGDGSQVADYRILGLVDLCRAVADKRPPRLGLGFAASVFAIMDAIATGAPFPAGAGHPESRPAPLSREEAEDWD